jgi:hypothetical protein
MKLLNIPLFPLSFSSVCHRFRVTVEHDLLLTEKKTISPSLASDLLKNICQSAKRALPVCTPANLAARVCSAVFMPTFIAKSQLYLAQYSVYFSLQPQHCIIGKRTGRGGQSHIHLAHQGSGLCEWGAKAYRKEKSCDIH